MSLYRRGETWHYDFWQAGERHRGTTRLRKKADATRYLENLRRSLALGSSDKQVPTLKQVAHQWFVAKVAGHKSEKTVAFRLEIMLRHLSGDMPVNEIGAADVQEAIGARRLETTRQGRVPTPATVNRDLIDTTLRPILRFARRNLEVPVRDIPWSDLRLKEPKGRTRTFTPKEIEAWRAALPEWHRPVFDFISKYGVRLKEAFFPLEALNLEAGRVTLRDRKNGGAHILPLLPEDAAAMRARATRAAQAGLDTVWFKEGRGGRLTPIHWRGYQSASRSALNRARIADARPVHDSRHHAATAALKNIGNLAVVKQLLGHESIASTARYAHVSDADVLAALQRKTPHIETTGEEKPRDNKAKGEE
ncbi:MULTISPECIES: tyrosine-type recombinase/integrase [unclassified Brevundimonas]|jgi:hypothetical protein|uniref:tyrosine-type recombinase/integrase n=1 Tax=unclassified Brevundimonas TaxID=2622653 RepID=UPI000C36A154|nr:MULTISPECIES: tyrosine-type recombinase/integrase [unclassified Brevundimonas]MAL89145.1 hypothetical protein [Brevundimonas sp.]HAJ02512.1 hypothetical protein [Brevundimonas sp.]HAV50459.1 hypothetical protein [Brevundimonas sp.]|tara:strand:- start:3049 stop:4140 length:1092 start_codon:yes stop_codon:yes gene_type:complete